MPSLFEQEAGHTLMDEQLSLERNENIFSPEQSAYEMELDCTRDCSISTSSCGSSSTTSTDLSSNASDENAFEDDFDLHVQNDQYSKTRNDQHSVKLEKKDEDKGLKANNMTKPATLSTRISSKCRFHSETRCQDKYFKILQNNNRILPPILYDPHKGHNKSFTACKLEREQTPGVNIRLSEYCSCSAPGIYLGSVTAYPTSYRFPLSSGSRYKAKIAANGSSLYCMKTDTWYNDIYEFVLNSRKLEMDRVSAKFKDLSHSIFYQYNSGESLNADEPIVEDKKAKKEKPVGKIKKLLKATSESSEYYDSYENSYDGGWNFDLKVRKSTSIEEKVGKYQKQLFKSSSESVDYYDAHEEEYDADCDFGFEVDDALNDL